MEKTEQHLKHMRRGIIITFVGLGAACCAVILLIMLLFGALTWKQDLLEQIVFCMMLVSIASCSLYFIGWFYSFIFWVRGLAMLSRNGFMKPMFTDIGLSVLCIVIPIITAGFGMFIMPVVQYLVHSGIMRKHFGANGKEDKQDLYSLGEIK